MADLGIDFNVADVPEDEFERLPPGRHLVQVIDSKAEDNKQGTGKLATFDMVVIQGELEGRHWFERVNYLHNNDTAQRIGQQTLAKIFKACGHEGARDTSIIHDIPFWIDVVDRWNKKANNGAGANERVISSFEPYDPGAASARPVQQANRARTQPATTPTQNNGGGTVAARPPGNWRNRA